MNKYKIAYVLTPVTFGGSEKVSLNFLKNVDREKFDIELIMFLRPWESENYFVEEISRLKFESHSIPVSNSVKGELLRVPRCLLKLKEILETRQYDLVHTHGYLADLLGFAAAKTSGLPVMSTCHGFIPNGLKLSLYNWLDLLALGSFDGVIAVSDSIRNYCLANGVCPDKIKVIENTTQCLAAQKGAGENDLAIRESKRKMAGVEPGEVLLGYSGRLSSEKGVADLITALKMLTESGMSIKLVLLGEGEQREELEELVARLLLTEKVCFAGFQTDIESWLTAMDIFVLPSFSEGTPLALLEAMAAGVPCVASAVGGIPQVIDSGVDGILVAPGKPGEIRNAIYSLCVDTVKREILSDNAKQKVSLKYNITSWTAKIESEYLNLLQMTSGTGSN